MHEFSVSSDIARTVLSTSEENKAKKVLSIQLEVGELALINVAQVRFWVKELFKTTVAEGAKVRVKKIRARIRCQECAYEGGMKTDPRKAFGSFPSHCCPRCGSLRIQIQKGRELLLRNIEAVR